jgi:hypothetical protein
MKVQWSGSEEELKQLQQQERLLKETEEKIKSLDSETNGTFTPTIYLSEPSPDVSVAENEY